MLWILTENRDVVNHCAESNKIRTCSTPSSEAETTKTPYIYFLHWFEDNHLLICKTGLSAAEVSL